MIEAEIWLPVAGYEGKYEVSNLGNVKSLYHKGRILSPGTIGGGYLGVSLYKDGKGHTKRLHRVVAVAFLKNLDDLPEVNHIDENKKNNAVSNLEWCTRRHNMLHGTRSARYSASITNHPKKSKPVISTDIPTGEETFYVSMSEANRQRGYSTSHISQCCSGKRLTHGNCTWRYAHEQEVAE